MASGSPPSDDRAKGFGRRDEGGSVRTTGFDRRDEGGSVRTTGFGRRDEGGSVRTTGFGRRDEGGSVRSTGFGRRDEGGSVRSTGFGRRDEGASVRNASFGRSEEGPSASRHSAPPVAETGFERENEGTSAFSRVEEGASVNDAEARIGQMLSGWRLDGLVGHGRTASVYIASNPDRERAAVKVMHRRYRGNVRIRRRLFREAQVARMLADAGGVTQVMASDVTRAGEPYVVMERLFGRDMDRLRAHFDGKVPLRVVLAVGLEAAETLSEAHRRGITHRNLSPFNVFVTVDGEVKLFDFGSALAPDEERQTLEELATDRHGYLAPELLEGGHGDRRSDVYSLGMVLFSLLGGARIGDPDHDPADVLPAGFLSWHEVPSTVRELRPDIDPTLADAIDATIVRDPRERPPDLSGLIEVIAGALRRQSPALAHDPEERRAMLAETLGRFVDVERESANELTGAWRSATLLREMFRLIENVLFSARRHGWEHDETELRLEHLVDVILEAVADDPDGIYWIVRPYSMDFLGESVWQPEPPFDALCYNLFDSGFRKMHLLPGLDDDECRKFLRWLVLDPDDDLPAEDDLATVFWSLEFTNVRCELLSAVVLQDVEDYDLLDRELRSMQADAIKQLRSSVQARLSGEEDAIDDQPELDEHADAQVVGRISAVNFSSVLRSEMGASVENAIPLWRGRLARILLQAMNDARAVGDLPSVLGTWQKFVDKALRDRHIDDALEIFGEIADQTRERDTVVRFAKPFLESRALWQTLAILVPIQSARTFGDDAPFFARRLFQLLRVVPKAQASVVIDATARCEDRALLSVLLKFTERHLAGHETQVADVLRDAKPLLGTHLIRILSKNPSREGIQALTAASENSEVLVRIAAAEVLARYSPKRASRELKTLLHEEDTEIRKRAVESVRVNRITELGELLIGRLGERSFHHLPADERRHILLTIYEVADERGEQCVTELVSGHGLVRDDDLDVTRLIAVGLLEQIALSDGALRAVEAAAKKRWWNSQELQKTATRAAETIRTRIADLDRELAATRGRKD